MGLRKKLFGSPTKSPDDNNQQQVSVSTIDLNKVFPRLKGLFDDENPDPVQTAVEISVTVDNEPVIKPLAKGIGICYMIDKGDSYQIIQNRHLSSDLTIEKLHDAALTNMAILYPTRLK